MCRRTNSIFIWGNGYEEVFTVHRRCRVAIFNLAACVLVQALSGHGGQFRRPWLPAWPLRGNRQRPSGRCSKAFHGAATQKPSGLQAEPGAANPRKKILLDRV